MNQQNLLTVKKLNPHIKTIDISRSSQFANGFLTRLSARVPNLQEVKLKIHKKEIISGGDELYDIVMPYTHLKTLKVDINLVVMMIAQERMKMSMWNLLSTNTTIMIIIQLLKPSLNIIIALFLQPEATLPLLKQLINWI